MGDPVSEWLKKARGLAGLTSLGGLVGALFGGLGTALTALVGGGGLSASMVLLGAGVWGGIAAVATAGVGLLLVAGGPRESLQELSASKAGLLGLIIGATAPLLLNLGIKVVLLGLSPTITVSVAASMAVGGALCGTLGAGLVAIGKKADSELLVSPSDP